MEKRHFQKAVLRMKFFLSLQSSTCHIADKGYKNMFLLVPLSKSKFFHSCRSRVVPVALVLHSCCQCSTRVALVLHSHRSCLTRVASVAHVLHSCRTRVARVWHSCCKLDQIFKKYNTQKVRHKLLHMSLLKHIIYIKEVSHNRSKEV